MAEKRVKAFACSIHGAAGNAGILPEECHHPVRQLVCKAEHCLHSGWIPEPWPDWPMQGQILPYTILPLNQQGKGAGLQSMGAVCLSLRISPFLLRRLVSIQEWQCTGIPLCHQRTDTPAGILC